MHVVNRKNPVGVIETYFQKINIVIALAPAVLMNVCVGAFLVLLQVGYLITPEIVADVARRVYTVMCPANLISTFSGQYR